MSPKRRVMKREAFADLVKTIAPDLTFEPEAIEALRRAAEHKISECFEDTKVIADASKRTTVMPRDLKLACRIRKL